MRSLPLILTTVLVVSAAKPARSQSALQFSAIVGGTAAGVVSGGTVALTAADFGQPVVVTISIHNAGSQPAAVSGIFISGTSEITLTTAPAFPVAVAAGGNAGFSIQYLPATGSAVKAQVAINYVENGQPASFQLAVTGTSPRPVFSYSMPPNGGLTPLNDGDNIAFPGTNVGSSSTVTVNIANHGSATAMLQSVAVTGAAFQLSGAGGPLQLPPGAQTSFFVIFSPRNSGGSQGLLAVALASTTMSFSLGGTQNVSGFTVTYRLADQNVHAVSDGAAIVFPPTDANSSSTATVEILSQGDAAGTVSSVSISGNGFRLNGLPLLPATLSAGQTLRFGIIFTPTQAGNYSGTFRIDLSGRSISGSLAASTAVSSITLAYVDSDTNNALTLQDGMTVPFPDTVAGTSSSVALVFSNNGTAPAVIDTVVLNAAVAGAFQLINLPALPSPTPPGQQVRFGVRFSPPQQQAYTGTLAVSINGRTTTVKLQGQGSGQQFTYSFGSGATMAAAGGTVTLNDTGVGQTTSVAVAVTNAGKADGQVASISVTGSGFAISDLPPLPVTLGPGRSEKFTLSFSPTQPGAVQGRLNIGKDTLTLTATAVGSRLVFSYTATAAVTVPDGGTVIFPPMEVGKSEKVQFAIQNTGTTSANILSINLAVPGSTFALQELPALPFDVDAGETATFLLSFTPAAAGSLTGTLRVNNNTFILSGSGTPPSPLPPYQLQMPSGAAQPAQQPAIGLSLSSPYPVAIDGTLKLAFNSTVFTDDPAIQFASGGRSVNFTIPANSTRAMFNGNPSMTLQTGTTAGTIVITPSFAMPGGFNITPTTPDTLTIVVPRSAPQLLSASITAQTPTGFTLILSGYSTTRAMRQLDVQFTPKEGEDFSTTKLTIDVNSAASAWYQSTASQAAGGSFLAAIPFVLQNGGTTDDLVHRLQSLTITATNDSGVSSAVTVQIP